MKRLETLKNVHAQERWTPGTITKSAFDFYAKIYEINLQ